MFSIANLLERAKKNANIDTDYRLAKIISINQSALGNYRAARSWPNDKILAQLCALSGDDPQLVMAQIQAERASSDEAKNLWMTMAKRLAGGASTAILSVLWAIVLIASIPILTGTGEAVASQSSDINSLYIV